MKEFNKVYAVGVDAGEYLLLQETMFEQSIQLTSNDIYTFNGNSKGDDWRVVDVDWLIVEGETPTNKPDVAGWGAMAFVIPAPLKGMFEPTLRECCEFLPLNLNGEEWFALNILEQQDAINQEHTELNMKNGRVNRIRRFKKLALSKNAIKHGGLFKVKGAGIFTFCTDEEGGLYDLVKSHNLKGLKFTEVNVI
ncbi:hypothetical protein [Pseudoalteromonas sp. SG43-4]|uniref:hypothetical protein n=1 Tax=Pseudoalteromonas sp. SG43-4 TaxID=2760969 RepID=UPI001602D078|nr:hypothetical protein [Pseudoalteromonas sp. SG43-4]MBB1431881.1 hypothetical protein [Pseudoalteromonas sp. SG43-4]